MLERNMSGGGTRACRRCRLSVVQRDLGVRADDDSDLCNYHDCCEYSSLHSSYQNSH